MTVKITKPEINLREKLSELETDTGIKGEELIRADTSAEAREALQLDQQLFTDFESTGIDDNATSTAITLDSSGNVGIGTTTISRKLNIQGNQAIRLFNDAADSYLDLQHDSNGAVIQQAVSSKNILLRGGIASGQVVFETGGSERMRIEDNGDVNISEALKAKSYNETYVAIGANNIDCETGNFFSKTISANTTFTFSNPPASGTGYGFVFKLTVSGTRTVTWPSSVDWAGGTAPDAPASGETDVLCFITHDGGTTWYGFLAGDAVA